MSRRPVGAAITLYRTRNTGTNRARQVVVCECSAPRGCGSHNAGPNWPAHVTISLTDAVTGDRYFLSLTDAAYKVIRDSIHECGRLNAEAAR